jgi:signal transduction histidine kinase
MDAATLANIFTPFFTTKPADKGTGLGLATAAAQVERMGGFIGVTSQPGTGAQFDVYLPLAPAQPVP